MIAVDVSETVSHKLTNSKKEGKGETGAHITFSIAIGQYMNQNQKGGGILVDSCTLFL
jgi:hypothetical protein